MTATNHMLTGAVIAATIRQPALVVPLAFLSHFVLDMIPHFGVEEDNSKVRNNHPLFRKVLTIDIIVLLAMLFTVPFFFDGHVRWWVILLGMLAAYAPDSVWLIHFWQDRRGHERKKIHAFNRFHQRIQWFEQPPGLITEVIWFAGALTVLTIIGR